MSTRAGSPSFPTVPSPKACCSTPLASPKRFHPLFLSEGKSREQTEGVRAWPTGGEE